MRILLNIGFIIAFLIGYMEWGGGNSAFVFEAMSEILFKKKNLLETITHPIILAGLLGLLTLLYSAFAKKPHRIAQVVGIVSLGIVIFFIFLAGLLSLNVKSLASVMPYFILCFIYFTRFHKSFFKEN
ncbi:MAG: hypothetical protein JNL70_19130 [Saprospiraceae bacterium]|nr:hypothetical protein [Saprospiraceae bacterium]